MNRQGQALIETALFMNLFALLLWSMVSFTKWMLVREKLIVGVREGAMLYSGGHITARETERYVRELVAQGWPEIPGPRLTVFIGHDTRWGKKFKLDVIRLTYHPDSVIAQYFNQDMEEQCVIKHAPDYGIPLTGPAVHW